MLRIHSDKIIQISIFILLPACFVQVVYCWQNSDTNRIQRRQDTQRTWNVFEHISKVLTYVSSTILGIPIEHLRNTEGVNFANSKQGTHITNATYSELSVTRVFKFNYKQKIKGKLIGCRKVQTNLANSVNWQFC